MNEISQKSKNMYNILGLDVCTDICPNLNSFMHFLLSGEGGDKSANSSLHFKKDKKIDEQVILEQIGSSINNVFRDSQLSFETLKNASLSIFIQDSFPDKELEINNVIFNKQTRAVFEKMIGCDANSTTVIPGKFRDTFLQFLSAFENSAHQYSVFISPFLYRPADDNSGEILGFASLLLSKKSQELKGYAQLSVTEQTTSFCEGDEGKQNHLDSNSKPSSHFIFAPLIQMIGTILEVHNKVHFSLTQYDNHNQDRLFSKQAGKFIRPWFTHKFEANRQKSIIIGKSIELKIKEIQNNHQSSQNPFHAFRHFILPLSFDSAINAEKIISQMISTLQTSVGFVEVIKQEFDKYRSQEKLPFTLVVLGNTSAELIGELDRAREGVIRSFESGRDWQTPNGSFFTPKPMGLNSKIAFVYPGAFNTYVGMGSELFYLFPDLYDELLSITENPSRTINKNVIFPEDISSDNTTNLQNKLFNNPIQMISSGVCFSYLYTKILRDYFSIEPSAAFGYSLGENSMMFAMGIWSQTDAMRTSLEVSPIFHSRVSGDQSAIREYWKIPQENAGESISSLWANYVVMASKEDVEQSITENSKVYITHINTSRQVVIGGRKNDCQKILDSLKCMHLQAPYHHAIHCAPVVSEYDGFYHLNNWPVENAVTIPIYSAANYTPLELEPESNAHAFAKMLTNPVDFPRLVDLAYEDGARIFIELGAGSNCTKWVSAILKDKSHLAVSINQVNVSDHVSILRLISRLISHNIRVNLDRLGDRSDG